LKPLIIKGSEFSPQITLNPETFKFEIAGESRPEDAGKLYVLVLEWLETYLASSIEGSKNKTNLPALKIVFEFNLVYFNTVSAKYILEILRCLHLYYSKGIDIKVKWYYKAKDEDMQESGEEFARLVNVPFEFIKL
jgi:hypothetical protein